MRATADPRTIGIPLAPCTSDTLELRIDVPQDVPAAIVDVDVAKRPAVSVTTQPPALGDAIDGHVFYPGQELVR